MNSTLVEWLANILNVICVILILFNKPLNWIAGIANCILYIAVFIPVRLYGDASLQVVYIALSLYGLYMWLFGKGGIRAKSEGKDTELPMGRLTASALKYYIALFAALSVALVFFLKRFTDTDVPLWDGMLTAISLTATVMMAKRLIFHWWLWIFSNVFYFGLYFHKGLFITMWFQIPLLLFSIAGYFQWKRVMRRQTGAST